MIKHELKRRRCDTVHMTKKIPSRVKKEGERTMDAF